MPERHHSRRRQAPTRQRSERLSRHGSVRHTPRNGTTPAPSTPPCLPRRRRSDVGDPARISNTTRTPPPAARGDRRYRPINHEPTSTPQDQPTKSEPNIVGTRSRAKTAGDQDLAKSTPSSDLTQQTDPPIGAPTRRLQHRENDTRFAVSSPCMASNRPEYERRWKALSNSPERCLDEAQESPEERELDSPEYRQTVVGTSRKLQFGTSLCTFSVFFIL